MNVSTEFNRYPLRVPWLVVPTHWTNTLQPLPNLGHRFAALITRFYHSFIISLPNWTWQWPITYYYLCCFKIWGGHSVVYVWAEVMTPSTSHSRNTVTPRVIMLLRQNLPWKHGNPHVGWPGWYHFPEQIDTCFLGGWKRHPLVVYGTRPYWSKQL